MFYNPVHGHMRTLNVPMPLLVVHTAEEVE